jgi:hypothetical protein
MKTSAKICSILLWICHCSQSLMATNETRDIKKLFFSGSIEGSSKDSVSITLKYVNIGKQDIKLFTTVTTPNGSFYLIIPGINIIGVRLTDISLKSNNQFYKLLNGEYMIEPGDNIFIDFTKKDNQFEANFSGKGSSKYTYSKTVDILFSEYHQQVKQESGNSSLDLNRIISLYDYYMSATSKLLDQFKTQITRDVYQIMKADLIGELLADYSLLEVFNKSIKSNNSVQAEALKLYKKFIWNDNSFSERTVALSLSYQSYLLRKSHYKLLFINHSDNITFRNIYFQEKKDYKGIVRDILLVTILKTISNPFSLTNTNEDSTTKLWNDAAATIKTPILREYAIKRATYKMKGSKVFDSFFEATNGNKIRLKELKGKVLFIDAWFTGCISCVRYAMRLEEEVYPQFKNDPHMVFISISADKDRKQWLKSVQSGKYTRFENLNLYTLGLGFDHPFLKYYEFKNGGVILLIGKDGKLFAGDPPYDDLKTIVSLIKNALGKPN